MNALTLMKYLVFLMLVRAQICYCGTKVRTKFLGRYEKVREDRSPQDGGRNLTDSDQGRGFSSLFTLAKVINFFPVGGERECQPTGYHAARAGICLNTYDCAQREGRAAGDCARGLGVCCVFEVTCGGTVQNNLTYFVSPNFPELWTGARHCNITIEKVYAGITQLRIDFVHFTIGQPNRVTGECDEDVMILGEGSSNFTVCGQNHGQHIYYTLSSQQKREAGELPSPQSTRLSVVMRGSDMPRLWLLRLAQMPLAHAAPQDCLQYHTTNNGTIKSFNFASNGRHLASQDYKACIRRNTKFCAIRYVPCDRRSFRIGESEEMPEEFESAEDYRPGALGGPGSGFYGPDGSFLGPQASATMQGQPTYAIMQQGEMPPQQLDDEGSGFDPDTAPLILAGPDPRPDRTRPGPTRPGNRKPKKQGIMSMIWSYLWPSWLWGRSKQAKSLRWHARTLERNPDWHIDLLQSPVYQKKWDINQDFVDISSDMKRNSYTRVKRDWQGIGNKAKFFNVQRWSPYAQHFSDDYKYRYSGYGNFGQGLYGLGRQRCKDRVTIPCENEYFIASTSYLPGVCDPHHCGRSFCPASPDSCRVETSIVPFAVSFHFGPPAYKRTPEDNIGVCLKYTQLPCDD